MGMWFKWVLVLYFTVLALAMAASDDTTPAERFLCVLINGLLLAGTLYFWGR